MSNSFRPHGLQHNRPPCPSPTLWSLLKLMSIKSVMPSNNLILCHPLLLSSIFPSIRVFSLMNQFFASGGQSIGVSVLASVLPMNIQFDFLKDRLIWSPCSPRDSQESSQTQKFKSINSSVLSLLYGPTLRSVPDGWKNHSFDYALMYFFSYLEPVFVPCPVLTVASWPAYRFLKRQVRWSGMPISQNFPQLLVT